MRLLANFYFPAIRLQLIICGSLLALAYLLSLYALTSFRAYAGSENHSWTFIYSASHTLAEWIYFTGPLIFTMCGLRAVATTLPASWVEKSAFMFLYVFVLFPLFLAMIWYALTGFCSMFTTSASVVPTAIHLLSEEIGGIDLNHITSHSLFANIITQAMVAACTCFTIVNTRRNRLGLGIVTVFGTMFLNNIASCLLAVYAVLSSESFMAAVTSASEVSPEALMNEIFESTCNYMPLYCAIYAACTCIITGLTIWKIKTRQN